MNFTVGWGGWGGPQAPVVAAEEILCYVVS